MTPIGTKYSAAASLCEQRTSDTYHQRMPWPDRDADRVQDAMLNGPPRHSGWVFALTCLLAIVCGLATVRGCT